MSSSWKQRDRVRTMAHAIRDKFGLRVYDFTDPVCRKVPEIPPEAFPEQFDSSKMSYAEYITGNKSWYDTVYQNREAIARSRAVILLLPCGNDAHADWAYAVGRGLVTAVVGNPNDGERTPSHLWSETFCRKDESVLVWLENEVKNGTFEPWALAKAAYENPWSDEEEAFAALCVAAIRLSHRTREERETLRDTVKMLGEARFLRALAAVEWLKPAVSKIDVEAKVADLKSRIVP